MRSNKINFLSSEAILNQLPVMLACMNLEHQIIATNKITANLHGYKNTDLMLGDRLCNIPCAAATFSTEWEKQNENVIHNHSLLTFLDIHPYANDRMVMVLAKKSPVFDNDKIIGVGFTGMEIQQQTIMNIAFQIAKSDKKYRANKNVNQRSYSISTSNKTNNLSTREMECLFYLVRGKSARETAELLKLSKRTVEDHIENIKNKMGCYTKSQVIEKALDNNLIDIIPETILPNMNFSMLI